MTESLTTDPPALRDQAEFLAELADGLLIESRVPACTATVPCSRTCEAGSRRA